MRRALIVCPGRGSYDRSGLGQLRDRSEGARAVIDACDEYRASQGHKTVSELDAAEAYRSTLHVAGENASLLTFACSLADLADLDRSSFEVVGVTGNSMGWYTALAASGALALPEAIRLVETMAWYQHRNVIGGQVLYPLTNDAWQTDAALEAELEATMATIRAEGGHASWSIRLGGYAVLGGDKQGVKLLMDRLPEQKRGSRTFPIQLPMHSAFHTPLMAQTSDRARAELADLQIRPPKVPLVDGRGMVFQPFSADPVDMLDYTLGHQVHQPYDFTTAVRAALRHTGADTVVALGPGNALGGPLARILVEERWHNCRDRASLDEMQQSEAPPLLSFGVRVQRRRLVG